VIPAAMNLLPSPCYNGIYVASNADIVGWVTGNESRPEPVRCRLLLKSLFWNKWRKKTS